MFNATPQPAEASAKTAVPIMKIRRRPNRSPREPPTRIKAPRNNPYDSITHCTSTTVARRDAWSEGRATFTAVLSIKAMLEARIVAARIQRPACALLGTSTPADRITVSSQGNLTEVRMHLDDERLPRC